MINRIKGYKKEKKKITLRDLEFPIDENGNYDLTNLDKDYYLIDNVKYYEAKINSV